VRETGYCALGALSRDLAVSEMTVRRDVHRLAEHGLVRVVHGGVSAVTDLLGPVDFGFRSNQHLSAKRAIAKRALAYLEPSSVVALDAGTTLLEVARRLPPDRHLTVVTHSLPVMATVAHRSGIELIGLGGGFHQEAQEFAGPLALRSLSQLRIKTLLLGAAAVREGRLWSTNGPDAEMKQGLLAAADEVVLLADSSKFAYSALMMVADLSAVTTVITDELLGETARRAVSDAGVKLVIVPTDEAPSEVDAPGSAQLTHEAGGGGRSAREAESA
jgi:DeoR/GlpR family transcriptional regulator of sugar metabolism